MRSESSGKYIEGEGLRLHPDTKSSAPGEIFPAKERDHVFKVEAMPVERKIYHTSEGVPIEVSCRAFFPVGSFEPKEASTSGEYKEGEGLSLHEGVKHPHLKKEGESGAGVVVLPGVGIEAGGEAGKDFGEAFARASKEPTYVVTTKVMQQLENSTYQEADAVKKFLREKGMESVIIAGNSMGGYKAVDLVSILQKEKSVDVRGLALLSSVGLRETTPLKLGVEFFAYDPAVSIVDLRGPESSDKARQHKNKPASRKRADAMGREVIAGIGKYLAEATSGNLTTWERMAVAWQRIAAELKTASQVNPRLKEIECPVVLISGDRDLVSGVNELVGSEGDSRSREAHFKKEIFPKSAGVKVIMPKEMGGHGVSILRAQEVAGAAIHSIKRMRGAA